MAVVVPPFGSNKQQYWSEGKFLLGRAPMRPASIRQAGAALVRSAPGNSGVRRCKKPQGGLQFNLGNACCDLYLPLQCSQCG